MLSFFLFFSPVGYDLSHWRIPGVLQRFGVSYLVVGLVDIFVPSLNVVSNVVSSSLYVLHQSV